MFEASHAGPAVLGVPRPTLWEGALTLARLAAVGLVGIGLSAILALAMGAVWGAPFVSGDLPGVTYTAERCQDLMEYAPGATSCEAAAAEHHFTETVVDRAALGVLGLGLAAGVWWVNRRRPRRPELLPAGFDATVGATAFGMATAGLLALGANAMVVGSGNGAGQWLSGAVVAGAVAVWYGIAVLRVLRRPRGAAEAPSSVGGPPAVDHQDGPGHQPRRG